MKYFLVLLVCISSLLTGCMTPNRMPMADYSVPKKAYPPVSITVNDGQITPSSSGNVRYVSEDAYFIYHAFLKTRVFENVDIYNPHTETAFLIQHSQKPVDSMGVNLAKVIAGGLTICLVPMNFDFEYTMNIDVRYRDSIIASYSYKKPLRNTMFLLKHPYDENAKMLEVMVAQLIHDLQKDKVFERLAAAGDTPCL